MYLPVQNIVVPRFHLLFNCFVNSFQLTSSLPCGSLSATQFFTSSAPLMSTSNPVSLDEPTGAPSTALICSYLRKTSSAFSLSLYCASSIVFIENSKVPIRIQHQVQHQVRLIVEHQFHH